MQNDQVIENRRCKVSGKEFSITQKDIELYKKISPKIGKRLMDFSLPTLCPEERRRRRLAFRNERSLYRRQCDASKKPIISMYKPDCGYRIYSQKIWRGDTRDALDHGRDFDFSKTFNQQFKELMVDVPRMAMINMNSENSDYCNPGLGNANCYMVFSITDSVGCMHGRWVDSCEYCIDCLAIEKSQYCSNSVQMKNCYDCHFCTQMENCSSCIGCVGLTGKQYCIENIQYSKEEFLLVRKHYKNHILPIPKPELYTVNLDECEECTVAFDTDSSYYCNDIRQSSRMRYSQMVKPGCDDCIDTTLLIGASLNREIMSTSKIVKGMGLVSCRDGDDIRYSDGCYGNSAIFGCVSLRNKKYCILNKQYTKEEYETLVLRIIEHMQETGERGEFFDPNLSPFGYNETVAHEYFPLEKTEAMTLGYNRNDYELPQTQVSKTIHGSKLPEMIEDVEDEILKTAIECEVTGKLFRIIPQELVLYRKHGIPLPRKHPNQRYLERLAMRK